jgi:hypothetical protein
MIIYESFPTSLMKKLLSLSVIALFSCVTSPINAQTIYQLTPIPTFGTHGDGSLRPGEGPFDALTNQRGMAYDPTQTNLIVVDTHTGPAASDRGVGNIFVLNALTGGFIDNGGGNFVLNTNGIGIVGPNQAYPYAAAAVAVDGVVYVCNQVNNVTTTPFIIYRWESSLSTNPPTVVFSNTITPQQRYATSIDIRGTGPDTQMIIGQTPNGGTGTNVVIFTTSLESIGNSANAAGLPADGNGYVANDNVTIKVYGYRTTTNSNVRIYSPASADSSAVTSNDVFTVNWTWNAVIGAEGYRVLRNVNGAGYNEYKDVSVNSDSDANSGWTAGSTVTPSTGYYLNANVLGADVTSASFNGGVAFGHGNTFWAKQVGIASSLRCFAFDLVAHTATTIKSYNSTTFPDNNNLDTIAVNTNLNLLVAIEQAGGDVGGGPERVRLYDISNFSNSAPALLDVETFIPNNQNATAPMGYVDFVGTNVYAYVVNNGLMAFSVGLGPLPAPRLSAFPAATNQTVVGQTVSFTVAGFPSVSYQWQSNGVDIANATNGTLTLVNVQTNFAATYNCVVTNSGGSTNASTLLKVLSSSDFFHLNLQWSAYPGDGFDSPSLKHSYIQEAATPAPGTPNVRQIAYNPLSNHLYAVRRSANNQSNYTFNVINAATGDFLYTLNTNGMNNGYSNSLAVGVGGVGLVAIAVAEDGAIYACNEAPQSGGGANCPTCLSPDLTKLFRIWRWADGNSNTLPVQIYVGDPAINGGRAGSTFVNRWGDNMAVRGSGTNTQLILDNNNSTARYVAFLTPTDTTMTNWTQNVVLQSVTGTTIGRSLQFGDGATTRSGTLWQKRRATALIQSAFDLDNPLDPAPALVTSTAFTNALCGGLIDSTRNLLFGVETYANTPTPDTLSVYEIGSLTSPILLAQYNFPVNFGTNHYINTANAINQTIRYGDKLFSLNAGNGLMAFTIVPGPPTAPVFLTQPKNIRVVQGTSGSFTVTVDQQANFQWQKNGTNIPGATAQGYTITNAQFADAGSYRVVASNIFGVSTSAIATATILLPEDNYFLSPVWSVPPGIAPYLNSSGGSIGSPNERFIAYDSVAKQLYLTRKNAANSYSVYAIDPNNPSNYYTLNTNGIFMSVPSFGGSAGLGLNAIGASSDGSIYACNLSADSAGIASSNGVFRVYRWANAESNTVPVLVFTNDPGGFTNISLRWGDTMSVRGSGMETEILLDDNTGSYSAILKPANPGLTVFTNILLTRTLGTGPIGRSLAFGDGSTMWQKRKGTALQNSSYNTVTHTTSLLSNYNVFPSTFGAVGLDLNRHLAAGVDHVGVASTSPNTVNLYEISDFSLPVLLGSYNFPTNRAGSSGDNFISQTVFAGTRVFSLDANSGLMAFDIGGKELRIDHTIGSSQVTLSWYTNMTANYVLQKTLSLSPASWVNEGSVPVVDGGKYWVTNSMLDGYFYRLAK